jgi:hypothetical protein
VWEVERDLVEGRESILRGWETGELSGGSWLRGSVPVGETPLIVSPTPFTPFMTPSKSFLAGCLDMLRVSLISEGEEGSECVRAGVDEEGVAGGVAVRGVSAVTAVAAKAGEMVSEGKK